MSTTSINRAACIFLTGNPGVGKSTVIARIVSLAKAKGLRVGGMVTAEIREGRVRRGFAVIDVLRNLHGILAYDNLGSGPSVGRYKVKLDDLDRIGVAAIQLATRECDLVVIDEIGPMELKSARFRSAVEAAFHSDRPILGTIHKKTTDPLVQILRKSRSCQIFEVTLDNRDRLPEELFRLIYPGS